MHSIVFLLQSLIPLKVAYAQVNFLVSENASYQTENTRLNAKIDSLNLKLESTMMYCQELSIQAELED